MNTANRIAIIDRCRKNRDWEGLAAFLVDGDKGMRRRAARALGEVGDMKALPILMEATHDPDAWVRLDVIRSLGKLRAAAAFDVLISSLEDENIDIRMETLHTLGCTKDRRAIEPLIRALNDPHQEIRSGAAEALERIGWSPATAHEEILLLLAKKQWKDISSVSGFSPAEAWELIRGREEYVRLSLLEELAKSGELRSAPLVLLGMTDSAHAVRAGAAIAFVRLPSFDTDAFFSALPGSGNGRNTQ
jgi:HEAT repeat protein